MSGDDDDHAWTSDFWRNSNVLSSIHVLEYSSDTRIDATDQASVLTRGELLTKVKRVTWYVTVGGRLKREGPVWARERCRISPLRFLAECCKRQLNQDSFVLLYFRLFTFSYLYWVCLSVFSCTVLFASTSQVTGCEDRLRNDLYCVEWGVKLYSNQTKPKLEREAAATPIATAQSVRVYTVSQKTRH